MKKKDVDEIVLEDKENVDETVIKENKGIKWYVVVIICLSLIVLGLGGYILYDKLGSKEEANDKKEVLDVTIDNNEKEKDKDSDVKEDKEVESDSSEIVKEEKKNTMDISNIGGVITKEEAEAFLNDLVPTNVPLDLLIAETDEDIFFTSIRYLILNKKDTKDGERFVFKNSDIKDLAYKYYMRDNYDFITKDDRFVYDSSNQTYSSALDWGLFGTFIPFEKTREITGFNYSNNIATFNYCVKLIYDPKEHPDPENNIETTNYAIKLVKQNGVLRIYEISKQ